MSEFIVRRKGYGRESYGKPIGFKEKKMTADQIRAFFDARPDLVTCVDIRDFKSAPIVIPFRGEEYFF